MEGSRGPGRRFRFGVKYILVSNVGLLTGQCREAWVAWRCSFSNCLDDPSGCEGEKVEVFLAGNRTGSWLKEESNLFFDKPASNVSASVSNRAG